MTKKPDKFTSCDERLENECAEKLRVFIRNANALSELINSTGIRIHELAENAWVLATKYNILKNGAPVHTPYPKVITEEVKSEMFCETHKKIRKIKIYIKDIEIFHKGLEEKYRIFVDSTRKLDWNVESAFLYGNEKHKPLDYYINGSSDIMFYFNAYVMGIQRVSELITVNNINSFKIFQNSLKLDDDFLTLLNNVTNLIELTAVK